MKLDQKYFIPFMVIVAVFTMLFIVLTSFNFKQQQKERFTEYTLEYDSLLTKNHPYIGKEDSLRLGDLAGNPVLLVFWSSWSEKSANLLNEIEFITQNDPTLKVVAALVKDVTDSAEEAIIQHDFIYIDGTILFNKIRVPGIPSYLLLDENGNLVSTHVGYKEGAIKDFFQ